MKSELHVIPCKTNLTFYIPVEIFKQRKIDQKQIKNTGYFFFYKSYFKRTTFGCAFYLAL